VRIISHSIVLTETSGWLSGIYLHMGIFVFISGCLSGIYTHMGIFVFISGWLSGIYLLLGICLSISGWLCGIFVHFVFQNRQAIKNKKKLMISIYPLFNWTFFFTSMLIIQLFLKLLPKKRGKHSIIPTIAPGSYAPDIHWNYFPSVHTKCPAILLHVR